MKKKQRSHPPIPPTARPGAPLGRPPEHCRPPPLQGTSPDLMRRTQTVDAGDRCCPRPRCYCLLAPTAVASERFRPPPQWQRRHVRQPPTRRFPLLLLHLVHYHSHLLQMGLLLCWAQPWMGCRSGWSGLPFCGQTVMARICQERRTPHSCQQSNAHGPSMRTHPPHPLTDKA